MTRIPRYNLNPDTPTQRPSPVLYYQPPTKHHLLYITTLAETGRTMPGISLIQAVTINYKLKLILPRRLLLARLSFRSLLALLIMLDLIQY